jgi:hypothetical protein
MSEEHKRATSTKTTTAVDKNLGKWIHDVYSSDILSESQLNEIYENAKYKGFDRRIILGELMKLVGDNKKLAVEIIIVCAVQGPQKAASVELSNGRTLSALGVPSSNKRNQRALSCGRINAATADLAAFYLKKFEVPKKIPELECPGWLQFPSAGSISMPEKYRRMHREFAEKFSIRISAKNKGIEKGSEFNEGIYDTMVANAYLDPRLDLFS